jgi:hypothetical protein
MVCDNLNTHDISSLYEAFPPAEARRIWDKLEYWYQEELSHFPKKTAF